MLILTSFSLYCLKNVISNLILEYRDRYRSLNFALKYSISLFDC